LTEMGYPATKVGTGNNRKSYRPLSVLTGGGGPIPWEPSAVQRPIEVVADGGTVPGGSGQGSDPAPAQPDNPRSGPVFSSSWEGWDSSLRTTNNNTQHTTTNGVVDPPTVKKYGENTEQTLHPPAEAAKTSADLGRRVEGNPTQPTRPATSDDGPGLASPEGRPGPGSLSPTVTNGEKRRARLTHAEVAARAYQGTDSKQISKAEARAQLKEERRQAAIAEAQGEVIELPAVVDRAGHVVPVTVEQAAAVVRECVRRSGELTVDVEHSGYPVGHRDYVLRSVQLGDWQAVAIFHPVAHAATIRELLAEASRLVAHSATADLIPLAVAGLLGDDADAIERAWERMHDTVIPAKLA